VNTKREQTTLYGVDILPVFTYQVLAQPTWKRNEMSFSLSLCLTD